MTVDRFETKQISGWNEFQGWYEELLRRPDYYTNRWVFRGVSSAEYNLITTLEREAERSGLSLGDLADFERRIMNEFRRRLHHYSQHIPERHDIAEWLSLMQHYGAPTRLLDWTYSPYVAVYFAVEKPRDKKCALWALESVWYTSDYTIPRLGKDQVETFFKDVVRPKLTVEPEDTKQPQYSLFQYLFRNPRPGLFLVNPFKLSERSTIQQSVHLMAGDITKSFEENLRVHHADHDKLVKLEIEIDAPRRKQFLLNLHRMNINRSTLFPGLQGFAESLKTRVGLPEILSY
jgi:hypothetical protein